MALNERKHTVPAGGDNPSRAAIVGAFETVNDIVPVADVTERNALGAAVGATTSRPLYVHRADAPASQRLEVTTDGTTWRPAVSNNGGTTGLIVGTAPPAGTPLIIKTMKQQVVTNGSGDGSATYPGGAFPNGVLTAHANTATAEPFFWVVHSAGQSLSQVSLRAFNITTGTVAAGLSIATAITAIGW